MKAAVLEALLTARATQRPVVLATALSDGRQALLFPSEEGASVPSGGAADGPGDSDAGTPLLVDDTLEENAREAAAADESRIVTGAGGEKVFLRVYNPPLHLVVIGAVHIAQSLAPMAARAGFKVTVVDPRKAFATEERFPGVALVSRWPAEALASVRVDRRTAVVTLTHDPKLDDPALEAALTSEAFYVGALGSRRTHARRLERLAEAGVDDKARARIHAPVGLDIGARSPAEIAVSVLAEIVAVLRA